MTEATKKRQHQMEADEDHFIDFLCHAFRRNADAQRPDWAFSDPSRIGEEAEQIPLFMTRQPTLEQMSHNIQLSALQALQEEHMLEMEEVRKLLTQGNEEVKKGCFERAFDFYTKGMNALCQSKGEKEALDYEKVAIEQISESEERAELLCRLLLSRASVQLMIRLVKPPAPLSSFCKTTEKDLKLVLRLSDDKKLFYAEQANLMLAKIYLDSPSLFDQAMKHARLAGPKWSDILVHQVQQAKQDYVVDQILIKDRGLRKVPGCEQWILDQYFVDILPTDLPRLRQQVGVNSTEFTLMFPVIVTYAPYPGVADFVQAWPEHDCFALQLAEILTSAEGESPEWDTKGLFLEASKSSIKNIIKVGIWKSRNELYKIPSLEWSINDLLEQGLIKDFDLGILVLELDTID